MSSAKLGTPEKSVYNHTLNRSVENYVPLLGLSCEDAFNGLRSGVEAITDLSD